MLGGLLDLGRVAVFEQLPELVAEHAAEANLTQVQLYVVDVRGQALRELTGRGLDAGGGGQEFGVDSSLPGRAFRDVRTVAASASGDDGRVVHWAPVLDGTERLGVLRAELPPGDDAAATALRELAALVGLLLVSKREVSDSYARLTRRQPMTVAAEMQWHLMPPSSFANRRVVVGAAMEPAYEVGGDAFDYAVAGDIVHIAVFDAMGHDTAAGLASNLSVAACRAFRRQNADPITIGHEIERVLVEQFGSGRFVTAVLADLDTSSGKLSWVNYGHHPPVVIRGGRWVTSLPCPPAYPLGIDLGLDATVCQEQLEPGDRLLLYTDGVTEARDATGREFGLSRFVDFVVRHHADGLAVPETLRRLMRALIDHHGGHLQDDATVIFLEWAGPHEANKRI
ncbi:serine/threonine-protein phosphatase [Frankia sp. AgB1.9]|uniref:PP2C family protein-serine/threonine phosphatase n=1 Tax=unclassified Frankia TaxID=2632575 RepID=UPI0019343F79|nr:serine/threonine-protein phosphatase [Frankia sp. AgW1.1]MBL7552468.1 serine/threonine-protein phosphatase [Frankia sp. AgB1.9]MBL7623570.1 serine/threonine-protein phosphatase [Frankia sp. AgB1.8]